jgi:hypothetical protein
MEAESSRSRDGQSRKEVDIDEPLKNMKLHEAELDDVVLGKEAVSGWPQVKWLSAPKVLTKKCFGLQTLKSMMMAAWNPTQEVKIHDVEPNLFIIQASCLGDWKLIMEDGSWLFRGCAMMVEPFDGATITTRERPTAGAPNRLIAGAPKPAGANGPVITAHCQRA